MSRPDEEEELATHCAMVADWMANESLIPFFGAGVNLANRPASVGFIPGQYLPDAYELAENIAKRFNYPWKEDKENLPRVSWHAAKTNPRTFYKHLHNIFSAGCAPNDVHEFFARLPQRLAAKGYRNRQQLIVTTNYDDVLERAFKARNEPYDLLSYIAWSPDSREMGKFRHTPHGGEPRVIFNPNDINDPATRALSLDRTVILKIHGAVDGDDWRRSNFVVTEDDYIEYLANMKPNDHVPALLMEKMRDSNFLFLGYSLSDWNLRVLLNSVWQGESHRDTSWAVMHKTKDWDRMYWEKHKVTLIKSPLDQYFAALDAQVEALPVVGRGVTP